MTPEQIRAYAHEIAERAVTRASSSVTSWTDLDGEALTTDERTALRRELFTIAERIAPARTVDAVPPNRGAAKHPCVVCQHQTTLICGQCRRSLCQVHAVWNRETEMHPGGLSCPLEEAAEAVTSRA